MASTTITPAVARATRKMYQLLEDNFDPNAGNYLHGYSDERVAKECDISIDAVKTHRASAFGKLKPPNEIELLRREIDDLQTFALKTESEIKAKLRDVSQRLLTLQKRFD